MGVLSIKNLEKHENDNVLFPAFDLEVNKGEAIAIHSNLNIRMSLLKMFLGQMPMSTGEIRVLGRKLEQDQKLCNGDIGICLFDHAIYERLTILDNLKFFHRLYNSVQSLEDILTITQLSPLKHKVVRKLTFSEKRRVHFAILIIMDPSLFIFEEPDMNVDIETKMVFINILAHLKKKEKALLVLTTNMESAIAMGDKVYRLNQKGLHQVKIQDEATSKVEQFEKEEKNEEAPISVTLNKIPTKLNDKIILFDPPEIDYIEK